VRGFGSSQSTTTFLEAVGKEVVARRPVVADPVTPLVILETQVEGGVILAVGLVHVEHAKAAVAQIIGEVLVIPRQATHLLTASMPF
jgi:hypothetical protein